MKKAIHPFVSQTIYIALAVLFMAVVIVLFFNLYEEVQTKTIETKFETIGKMLYIKIYEEYEIQKNNKVIPTNGSFILLGETELDIPEKIFGKHYTIEAVNKGDIFTGSSSTELLLKTETPDIEYKISLPFENLKVVGKENSIKGTVKIYYYRFNLDGEKLDIIAIGSSNIIIPISQ